MTNMTMQLPAAPTRKIDLRPLFSMKNQEPTIAKIAIPKPPMETSYAWIGSKPAMTRK